jgi:hypothetical protein
MAGKSKAVESQQEEAARRQAKTVGLSPGEAQRRADRATLMLARHRALADLQHACAPAHRALLEQAVADLDRRLRELNYSTIRFVDAASDGPRRELQPIPMGTTLVTGPTQANCVVDRANWRPRFLAASSCQRVRHSPEREGHRPRLSERRGLRPSGSWSFPSPTLEREPTP